MVTRRVVTGNNSQGKSYIVHDGPTPGTLSRGAVVVNEIWIDDPANPDPTAARDPVDGHTFNLEPPDNGSVLRVITFPPQYPGPDAAREALGWHTTRTIDYAIVLSGEVDLELDEGVVRLKAGDAMVQRGVNHAWRNRSDEPCTMAAILVKSPNYR